MLLSISKPQGNEAIQCHPVWEIGFKRVSTLAAALLLDVLPRYTSKRISALTLPSLLPTPSYLGREILFSFSVSFPLIQLNAKTDNNSLAPEVRKKTTRQQKGLFEKQHTACYIDSFKACSCNWKYSPKRVYNKSLLQL